jgi:hypothetical protein
MTEVVSPFTSTRSGRESIVHVGFALFVHVIRRCIVVEKQETDREVVLLSDDGQFSYWLSEPNVRTVVYDAAAVHELALPDGR